VFLATLGPVAEHAARAGFVTNLLAAGGVPVRSAGRTQGPADLAAAWQGEPVVVVAGADPTYAVWGADAVAALRAAGARTVILAGAPPAELASLVDDHVAAGQDAIDFLRRLRAALPTEVVAR
jgi:methylmalonyl-CoA mutase